MNPRIPNKLSIHAFSSAPLRIEPSPDEPIGRWFQSIRIGYGDTMVASVVGVDFDTPFGGHGYPQPTIAEAQAIAAEIIHRWNSYLS